VSAVVVASVALGFATPDGYISGKPTLTPTAPHASTPIPTAIAPVNVPSADRAPATVAGTWPGRPAAATLSGDRVDWCPAVHVKGAGAMRGTFNVDQAEAAACAAVRFVFDKRYSRLAIPRKSYAAADLDFVLPALGASTVADVYRPRVANFLADPNSTSTRKALGLVLFRGEATPAGANHAAAGDGRNFYGKAFSDDGYRGRAAWINPTWSAVTVSVDFTKAQPRIVATLDASASMPVFNPGKKRDDMLTVPTHATFYLRQSGTHWKIGGWTITSGPFAYAKLSVN